MIFEELQKIIQDCYESIWSPKVLVCDAAKSVQNAFIKVFGDNVVDSSHVLGICKEEIPREGRKDKKTRDCALKSGVMLTH